jgi:uncharacterized protein
MELKLTTKPKNPTIIEGFPGLGLIGTIVTEYLIKHLGAKPIGYIKSDKIPPMVAIHESKIIQPLEVFYAKSKNLVILHALTDVKGTEWEISEGLIDLCKTLKAKEVVSIEGILGQGQEINLYYYSDNPKSQVKFNKAKAVGLKEGIVTGVTAAMLLKSKEMNFTGIFAETHSKLPDSKAAAKIIEMLDAYLDLEVDYKPLEAAAADFEKQLKGYVDKMQKTAEKTEDKAANYMG